MMSNVMLIFRLLFCVFVLLYVLRQVDKSTRMTSLKLTSYFYQKIILS